MFHKRIERERTKRNLTQEDVANGIGVARSTYGNYESGKREPDFETVQKLANFFGVSTEYLITGTSKTDKSVSPEEAEFLRWLDENMEDADVFFYDFHKSPEEQKRQFIETMRALWEVEKKRGSIRPKD